MKRIPLLILAFLCIIPTARLHAASEPTAATLKILYLEQAPYYYEQNGKVAGFLMKKSAEIFQLAGIPVTLQKVPPKRILSMIKANRDSYCSIGWFRNNERQLYAKFTAPIYQDLPFELLILKDRRTMFSSYSTFESLLSNTTLVFGATRGYSYGEYVDRLLEQSRGQIEEANSNLNNLHKLAAGRVDYMLVSPETVTVLADQASMDPGRFESISLKDIPKGNKRHIMCSQKVPDRLIDAMNAAIQSLSEQN